MRRVGMAGAALGGLAVVALTGCGANNASEVFGMSKRTPDEFQVVKKPPLVMPPNFSLRAPEKGALGPQDQSSSAEARATLTGLPQAAPATTVAAASTAPTAPRSPGETALLTQANVAAADPDIRAKIASEHDGLVEYDSSKFLMIFSWQKPKIVGTPIDPAVESQRLQAQGVPSVVTQRTASEPITPP